MSGAEGTLVPLDRLPMLTRGEGAPDVQGWDVVAADGVSVGSVRTLLVEPRSLKVRYVDITLNSALAGEVAHEPSVLIPVGRARVDGGRRRIRLERLDRSGVLELPAHVRTPPAPELEATLRRSFEPAFSGTALDRDFFESELYDPRGFHGIGAPSRSAL
jgi:photosynthetic reaction center H subunit